MIRALILLAAILSAGCDRFSDRDNSDMPDGRRSGFNVFTDGLTGCQYIGFGLGYQGKALTPRIAADGKTHQGCRGAKP